jgi:hypothetical protein
MQETCITTCVIAGNRTDIKFLHKSLLKLVQSGKTTLRHVAAVYCPHWPDYKTEGNFSGLSMDNPRQITFTVETISQPEPGLWFEVCRKYRSTVCYYYSAVSGSGRYKTNDRSGKYFPQRYLVVDGKGTAKAVVSHHELYKHTASVIPLSGAFDNLEAFGKAVSAHSGHIGIYDIIVVDNRDKCLTRSQYLIGQYLR